MRTETRPSLANRRALFDRFGAYPIQGSRSGYQTEGDVLVNVTADGTDINAIWDEFMATLRIYNEHRLTIMKHLSFPTTRQVDYVPQTVEGAQFERASEFGEPKSARLGPDVLKLGYDIDDYDLASRFTWRFLRDSDARQIQAVHENALEGDNRHITERVQSALLTNTARQNADGNTVYPLYNGDGFVPPPYLGRTFAAPHNHYMTTQGPLDSSDIEWAIGTVTEHGYGTTPGSQLLIFANPAESKIIQRLRANETAADGGISSYDFIPSADAPAYLTTQTIVGERPPGTYDGLKVSGSLGPAWLVETPFMPAGYVAVVASGGAGSERNPIGFREHPNVAYRGLRLIPGNNRYPLMDSFYSRTFGVGVRHRGAAAVLAVTAATVTTYTPPAITLP